MAMVQRLGDGQLICSACWAEQFEKPEPETGWIAGECDFCESKKRLKSYNGYRSWNAWNVSLWINNDEAIYNTAKNLVEKMGIYRAANALLADYLPRRTPDGAVYNLKSIIGAIKDIV